MFGALKRGRFRSMVSLILVRNVVGELQPKRTLAASRGFLAAARLSCELYHGLECADAYVHKLWMAITRPGFASNPFSLSPINC